ncbi:beta-aspartyl-peptidase (threonine type) [Breoghania corrubedonensis]|uniref:Isoaspartyl peptidase n=1 Tax=Breoghania corrubedonensis TaxID=665038 RepID=A0A2T5VC61_9HYPH|nr:isoaspartyl peptidase/L-asparaginase [Breoghania corrubedonensis]PTW61341.1 beta-aspartyl-peptidase (threonine type) [Breoghania corrubedonensis]
MADCGWALALHGGAGTILKETMTPDREAGYRAGLEAALAAGREVLSAGGSAEDAVVATVMVLEDNPLFNAGRGSVLTSAGTVEMDAAIMRGRDRAAGTVAGIHGVRNPICLARRVMERSDHVMFCGAGAQVFALEQGFEELPASYFETEHRRNQLREAQEKNEISLDHNDHKYGTVGCVARDRNGDLAAATSTGGMTNKRPGRVGDSPVIGAGTYASNDGAAISATGHGEAFIRETVARDIAALVQYAGLDLTEAVRRKVMVDLPRIGGDGGVIAIAPAGAPVLMFNTRGMYRASACEGGDAKLGIYAD